MVLISNSKFSAALMSVLLAQIARSLGALLDCFCFFHHLRLMFSSDERVGRLASFACMNTSRVACEGVYCAYEQQKSVVKC
jgi:hypothetical protein